MLNADYIKESMSKDLQVFLDTDKDPSEIATVADGEQDFVINEEKPAAKPIDAVKCPETKEPIQEGMLQKLKDWWSGKSSKKQENPKKIYNRCPYKDPTDKQIKAIEDYCLMALKAIEPKLKQTLNKFPKCKDMFTINFDKESFDWYINGECNFVSIMDYDFWDGAVAKRLGRAAFNDDPEFMDQFCVIFGEIEKVIDTSEYGKKSEYGGDWDDGTFDFIPDVAKLKAYVDKKCPNEEPVQEGVIDKVKDFMKDASYDNPDNQHGAGILELLFKRKPTKAEIDATKEYIMMAFKDVKPQFEAVIAKHPKIKSGFSVEVHPVSLESYLEGKLPFVSFTEAYLKKIAADSESYKEYQDVVKQLKEVLDESPYGSSVKGKWANWYSDRILFIPKPSMLQKFISNYIPTVKPTKESFNTLAESYFTGAIDDIDLQCKMESVLASDEDIFYNKKKFKDGETNLCFIVGLAGSGKSSMASTMARGAHNIEHYRLDNIIENKSKGRGSEYYEKMGDLAVAFFNGPGRKYYADDEEIKNNLHMSKDQYIEKITNAFVDFAVSFARSHDDTKFIIEGVQLHRYIDPSRFRDYAVCIKGTSIAKSMYQAGKRDSDFASPLKHTFQYAGDDLKLNKWKNMYKDLDKPDEDEEVYDDDEDEEYDERAIISTDNDELLYMEAFTRYMESNIENEETLTNFISSLPVNESAQVIHEAESLQEKTRNRFDKVLNFIARISDRFSKAMEKILLNQKGYLEKYQNVILNTKWSDTMQYAYDGDYKEAITRCMNFDMPQFNKEVYGPFLREDGYERIITRFTAGHNFKYDQSNENLAEQFKNYFLALDRGKSQGKFSQLEPKALYTFCHDQYNELMAMIRKDQDTLKRSETAFIQMARDTEREAAQNKQGQEQTETNQNANTNTNTAGKGGTTPIKTTGGTQPITTTGTANESAIINETFRATEHPEMWQDTGSSVKHEGLLSWLFANKKRNSTYGINPTVLAKYNMIQDFFKAIKDESDKLDKKYPFAAQVFGSGSGFNPNSMNILDYNMMWQDEISGRYNMRLTDDEYKALYRKHKSEIDSYLRDLKSIIVKSGFGTMGVDMDELEGYVYLNPSKAKLDEYIAKAKEEVKVKHETANPTVTTQSANTATTQKADTNLKITDTSKTQVDQNGIVKNKSAKTTNSTDDEDLTNMMTKWIKLCQAFTTGKYTAIQKISKDYMDIIRAHVKAHTSKDAKIESDEPNKQVNQAPNI